MTEIAELERRLTAALERIGQGAERLRSAGSGGEAALRDKLVAAELKLAEVETALLTAQDDLARQRRLAAELSEANARLTEQAQGAGVPDELAALRARRAEEKAELDKLLQALAPLVGEG